MKLRADDDIYRARLVYLGPPGYTLPIQLTFAQYALFAGLFAVIGIVSGLIVGSLIVIGPTLGASLILTSYISKYVNYDVSAIKAIKVGLIDLPRIPAQDKTEQLPRLSATKIRIRTAITDEGV